MNSDGETPKERIDRLIEEGEITEEAVNNAEVLWQERLERGIVLPTGESATITLNDLYHLIVDSRIARKPWRIEHILTGIFEVRSAEYGRRKASSRWEEAGKTLLGYVIFDANNSVRTMHLIDERRLRKLMSYGELLWKR